MKKGFDLIMCLFTKFYRNQNIHIENHFFSKKFTFLFEITQGCHKLGAAGVIAPIAFKVKG